MSLNKASNETKPYVFNNQIGKVYKGNTLIYQAQSDTYTITASSSIDGATVASSKITNTDNYEKMVIESVICSGGNFGQNRARLYCNGSCVLDTGIVDVGVFHTVVNSWGGTFMVAPNGQVYVDVYTNRDENRDDFQDAISVTVNFHFE